MDRKRTSNSPLLEAQCWVFDLDNTLYPASSNLFSQVDEKMTRFISGFLNLNMQEAKEIRKTYYREHGTTLNGLMTLHGLEPGEYLDYVHDIDLSGISPDLGLDRSLARLPGRKIIFTNGPTNHAERILERISIRHHFDAVFDIISADYIPKPDPEVYDALVERQQLIPSKTVMVEDLARNLEPAAALGMTTVWISPGNSPGSSPGNSPGNSPGGDVDAEPADGQKIHHIIDNLSVWLTDLTEKEVG